MVRAGEAGGVLDVILNRLADFQEKSLKLKKKVKYWLEIQPVWIFGDGGVSSCRAAGLKTTEPTASPSPAESWQQSSFRCLS